MPVGRDFVSAGDSIILRRQIAITSISGSIELDFEADRLSRSGVEFAGFGIRYLNFYTYNGAATGFVIPFWFVATLFGALPVLWIRRTNFRRPGGRERYCGRCGYDLRGLRGAPIRCPECGTVPSMKIMPKRNSGKLTIAPKPTIPVPPLIAADLNAARQAARITATKLGELRIRPIFDRGKDAARFRQFGRR